MGFINNLPPPVTRAAFYFRRIAMPLCVTALIENHSADARLTAARGLSLLLDDGDTRILFDTGPDARLIDHAEALGIDLASISHIVLSHGHIDHSGGLPALAHWYRQRGLRPTLVAHPQAFHPRALRAGFAGIGVTLRQLGAPISLNEADQAFQLELSATPLSIGRFVFLGEVARTLAFDRTATLGYLQRDGRWRPDEIIDDSGLAWRGESGLTVISGCAHSGICNMVQHASKVCADAPVHAVLGGFHLRSAGPLHLLRVRRHFAALGIRRIAACHCSGWGGNWLRHQQVLHGGNQLVLD